MRTPLYAGFDLGGTQLKYGLINKEGRAFSAAETPSPPTIQGLFTFLENLWNDLRKREKRDIKAAGFGFPGIFSLKKQRIIQSPNYPQLDNFDLITSISRFIDVPFWVNNDANMAAFGEYKSGAGQGVQSLVFLTIGTGVGTGVILDGKLWQGKCGFAGELGHATVNPEGEACKCGSRGCLETEVSAPKIVRNYMSFKNLGEPISPEEVYERAKKGESAALKAFSLAGYYLGIGLSIAINFLNPEKILLGGGVMNTGNFLLDPALEEAQKRSYVATFNCCKIIRAALGNKAGFIGAGLWAREQAQLKI